MEQGRFTPISEAVAGFLTVHRDATLPTIGVQATMDGITILQFLKGITDIREVAIGIIASRLISIVTVYGIKYFKNRAG